MFIICLRNVHLPRMYEILFGKAGLSFFTFIVVVFHCDDASSGGPGVVDDRFGVQGFDGEQVNHTNVDSL